MQLGLRVLFLVAPCPCCQWFLSHSAESSPASHTHQLCGLSCGPGHGHVWVPTP